MRFRSDDSRHIERSLDCLLGIVHTALWLRYEAVARRYSSNNEAVLMRIPRSELDLAASASKLLHVKQRIRSVSTRLDHISDRGQYPHSSSSNSVGPKMNYHVARLTTLPLKSFS